MTPVAEKGREGRPSRGPATGVFDVGALGRVEGEGGLSLHLDDERVVGAELRSFDAPPAFDALLRGLGLDEAPDVTARFCASCSIAHPLASVDALERALGVPMSAELRGLRRMLACGAWIEAHALHAFLLHAPDFLGFDDALAMGARHPALIRDALRIKKAGRALVRAVGDGDGLATNLCVGGFHRAPSPEDLAPLVDELRGALDATIGALRGVLRFDVPEARWALGLIALRHDAEYPMNEGWLATMDGETLSSADFDEALEEAAVPTSRAPRLQLRGRQPCATGPVARFALNHRQLSPMAKELAAEVGLSPDGRNPHRSLHVRLVELAYALEEALRLIAIYEPPARSRVSLRDALAEALARPALVGIGVIESPRGLLLHRCGIGRGGLIEGARMVSPTALGLAAIEAEVVAEAPSWSSAGRAEIARRSAALVRNHAPCFTCGVGV